MFTTPVVKVGLSIEDHMTGVGLLEDFDGAVQSDHIDQMIPIVCIIRSNCPCLSVVLKEEISLKTVECDSEHTILSLSVERVCIA